MRYGVAHVAALVLLVIGVSEGFFLAEMFGPSAELEAACPGSCQVRICSEEIFKDTHFEPTLAFNCALVFIYSLKWRHV